MEDSHTNVTIIPSTEDKNTTNDLIAGWLGGAVGILVSNPLEVLKVRLQTTRVPSSRVGAGSRSSNPSTASTSSASTSTSTAIYPKSIPPTSAHNVQPLSTQSRPSLSVQSLWKAEGLRFLFAGAAGPILGLAFIDSCFFGGYGIAMKQLGQDRQDPTQLSRVFLAGAASGASCALLQTPIEVVKCRAQAESSGKGGKKLGSFRIAQMIAKKEGLRGFYIGGLMTACRDGISSGIFFWGYFVFRRVLRGQEPFQATTVANSTSSTSDSPIIPEQPRAFEGGKMNKMEIARILLAGGLAGSLSAIVPYPFDIIKTRLQTASVESKAHPVIISCNSPSTAFSSSTHSTPFHFSSPLPITTPTITPTPASATPLTVRLVALGIHQDGMSAFRYRYSSTLLYSFLSKSVFPPPREMRIVDGIAMKGVNPKAADWAVRLLGLKGFLRGIKPTVISSFVGSAATITTFEIALVMLSGEGSGAGSG